MKRSPGCARAWEVEADHDGRLGAPDRQRLARHVERCADCRAERARLEALRRVARQRPRTGLPPLAARRARSVILRVFARASGPRAAGAWRRGWLVAAAVLLAVTAVPLRRLTAPPAVVLATHARPGPVATPRPRHALAEIEALDAAVWSRAVADDRETVVLAAGSLRVHVPAQRTGHRFVIQVPDGEVEVRGTRFRLDVEAGRLRRVAVTEGLVAVRVHGALEQLVPAGGVWEQSAVAVVAAAPRTPGGSLRRIEPPARARPRTAPTEAPPAAFASALAALDRGDFGAAAHGFVAFETANPHDELAEEAGFLCVVAQRRAGQDAAALTAAMRYLGRYPRGLRRWEAALVAVHAAPPGHRCALARTVLSEFDTVPARREAAAALEEGCVP